MLIRRRRILETSLSLILCLIIIIQPLYYGVDAQEPISQRIFTIGMNSEVSTINPFLAISDYEYQILGLIYDYFIYAEIEESSYPYVARSYWVMDGLYASSTGSDFSIFDYDNPSDWPYGSIWEYNLTEDAFWSDGLELTAVDVEFTIDLQCGSNFGTYWAFQPFTRWILDCQVVSDHKVRIFFGDIKTEVPMPIAFGNDLAFIVLPRHPFEGKEITYLANTWDGFPAIGSGPFKCTSTTKNDLIARESITLARNYFYNFVDDDNIRKGMGAAFDTSVSIDKLVIRFYSDEPSREAALKTGQLDYSDIKSGTYLNWLNDENLPWYLELNCELSTWQYSRQAVFNDYAEATGTASPLRLDPAVHRASTLATNKSLFVKSVFQGLADEGLGLLSPYDTIWWWEPGNELSFFNVTDGSGNIIFSYNKSMKNVMEFDLDLANQILDAAGYVWSGEIGNSKRIATDLVAQRMHTLFGSAPESVIGKPLEFSFLFGQEIAIDQQIFEFLKSQWLKAGISLIPDMVTGAAWSDQVYSYLFEVMLTYWSGDIDPNYLLYVPTSDALYGWNEFGTNDSYYDSIYINQATALDPVERKHWSDECVKWQYLSGSINTLCYPWICSGYSEKTWTNWSNEIWFFTVQYNPTEDATDNSMILVAGIIAVPIIGAISYVLLRRRRIREMESEECDDNDRSD